MIRRSFALIIAFLIAALSFVACSPKLVPDGWIKLTQGEVTFNVKKATLPVPPSAPPVKSLAVLALLNDIDFIGILVEFENGTPFEYSKRARLSPKRDSLVLDLPGERRKVRTIVVQYQNFRQTARRALIEIWGDPRY